LDLEITDITAKPAKVLFTSVKNKKSLEIYGHQDLVVNKIMPISSRQWQFSYHPTQGEDYQYSSWLLYWLITASFFALSLTGAFLLNIAGREQRIRQEVADKKLVRRNPFTLNRALSITLS
jgi:CHASE1-domain containing sensor protein